MGINLRETCGCCRRVLVGFREVHICEKDGAVCTGCTTEPMFSMDEIEEEIRYDFN